MGNSSGLREEQARLHWFPATHPHRIYRATGAAAATWCQRQLGPQVRKGLSDAWFPTTRPKGFTEPQAQLQPGSVTGNLGRRSAKAQGMPYHIWHQAPTATATDYY